jgi:prefoldin subunit 5
MKLCNSIEQRAEAAEARVRELENALSALTTTCLMLPTWDKDASGTVTDKCCEAVRSMTVRIAELESQLATLQRNLADAQGDCEQEAEANRQLQAQWDALQAANNPNQGSLL